MKIRVLSVLALSLCLLPSSAIFQYAEAGVEVSLPGETQRTMITLCSAEHNAALAALDTESSGFSMAPIVCEPNVPAGYRTVGAPELVESVVFAGQGIMNTLYALEPINPAQTPPPATADTAPITNTGADTQTQTAPPPAAAPVQGGLVPCGDDGEEPCQMCHFVSLASNVNGWLVGVLSVVAAIMFVIAGYRILTAGGNPSALKDAKTTILNVSIGFAIVVGAFLFVNFIMKSLLLGGGPVAPWTSIACVRQPNFADLPPFVGFPTANGSRGTARNTGVSFDASLMAGVAGLSAPDDVVRQAAAAAGLDAEQTRNLQALMRVESGGCRNNVSPVGALGCLQIMPATAKQYDSSLNGLSESQVRDRLLDPSYNISLGARIYADLYQTFDGDEIKVFAAYNGGPGALNNSTDCPGLARYQCVWDSPGCHDKNGPTGRTDCVPNTGYIETRNYVQKVPAVAAQLQ